MSSTAPAPSQDLTREAFAGQMRALRDAAGLTQSELAKKVHVGVSTVRRWERKGDQPQMEAARQLPRVLNIADPAVLRYLRSDAPVPEIHPGDEAGIFHIGEHVTGVDADPIGEDLREEAIRAMIAGLSNGFVTGTQYMDLAERVARITGIPW